MPRRINVVTSFRTARSDLPTITATRERLGKMLPPSRSPKDAMVASVSFKWGSRSDSKIVRQRGLRLALGAVTSPPSAICAVREVVTGRRATG
jgi:hypothetical protein